MATATTNSSNATDNKTPVRVTGNVYPTFLLGRPRKFWIEAMEPKKKAAPVFELDQFDLDEIIEELHYGADSEWAA